MASTPTVGVVGAGPAGIMAALEAREAAGPSALTVLLFDSNEIVGRKLLVTGSGRCNISNLEARADAYVCDDARSLAEILSLCGPQVVRNRLRNLGVPTMAMADGWCYPLSQSAASVVDILASALEAAGVIPHLRTEIASIAHGDRGFVLQSRDPQRTYRVDALVLAMGGRAHPALGSRGKWVSMVRGLGHTVVEMRPAAVPLVADMRRLHKLQGVRLDAGVTIWDRGEVLGRSYGNLLFATSGLSGPAVMDLSYLVSARPHHELTAGLDLLASCGDTDRRAELLSVLDAWQGRSMAVALSSVLPPKVPPVILGIAGLGRGAVVPRTGDEGLGRILDVLGDLRVTIRGTRGFDQAQLSSGGVPLSQVRAPSMASRFERGLFLAGEMLDVVGPCGGYNLHFAWATGMLSGLAAAKHALHV